MRIKNSSLANKFNLSWYSIWFLSLLASPLSVNGQIVTDRPDQTESPLTVGTGNFQIESGILLSYEGNDQSGLNWLLPTSLFRFGIMENVELRLVNQIELHNTEINNTSGISDLELGLKIHLLGAKEGVWQMALLSHLVLPTGTIENSNSTLGSSHKVCFGYSLNDRYNIGTNLGFINEDKAIDAWTYTLALGIAVNNKAGIFIEPFGHYSEEEKFVHNFNAGMTYLPNSNLQLDFSLGTGITNRTNFWSIGISWLLERSN